MTLSLDQLEVASFETTQPLGIDADARTVPVFICNSPRCVPTFQPDVCPAQAGA